MGADPTRVPGKRVRPLLESEILHAQTCTKSAKEASRYLNVNYDTYKKYAKLYGIFEQHKNPSGKGVARRKLRGSFGLDEILEGKHPTYSHTRLKERLIRAGYIEESCGLCGYERKREFDNRAPLVLHCLDGDNQNLALDNLQLRCYNCSYLTTGKISMRHLLNPGIYDQDAVDTGITRDEIDRIQQELMKE